MRICLSLLLFLLFMFVGTWTAAADSSLECPQSASEVYPSASSGAHDSLGVGDPFERDVVEYADAHSLALRLCLSAQRMNRFTSLQNASFVRGLLRQLAFYLSQLTSHHLRFTDSCSTLSFQLPSEHYVFGLRRLLL